MTRALLAWVAFAAGALFVVVDIVRLEITGVFALGAALLAFWFWQIGGFTAAFWGVEPPDSTSHSS